MSEELNFHDNQLLMLVSLFKKVKFFYPCTLAEETLFSAILPTPPTHPTLALCSAKLVEIGPSSPQRVKCYLSIRE